MKRKHPPRSQRPFPEQTLDIFCADFTLGVTNPEPDAATSNSALLPATAEELLPLVYEELRRLAAQIPGQSLQATALVHEA